MRHAVGWERGTTRGATRTSEAPQARPTSVPAVATPAIVEDLPGLPTDPTSGTESVSVALASTIAPARPATASVGVLCALAVASTAARPATWLAAATIALASERA